LAAQQACVGAHVARYGCDIDVLRMLRAHDDDRLACDLADAILRTGMRP
jgi:hypothetical protein